MCKLIEIKEDKWLIHIILMLLILSFFYFLQIVSPLRLNNDVIVFLSLADSFINGSGFIYRGMPSHFPQGYPILIAILDYIGMGHSWGFILLNLLFLFVGNIMLFNICHKIYGFNKSISYSIIILSLLSWVFIKHVTLALSDIVFYGLSMASVYVLSIAESNKYRHRCWLYFLGFFLISISIAVRTIGVAILFAFLILKVIKIKNRLLMIDIKYWIILIIFIISSITIMHTEYFNEALIKYSNEGGFLKNILWLLFNRMTEIGKLLTNMPASHLPNVFKSAIQLIGFGGFIALAYIISQQLNKLQLVDYYIITYLSIIMVWPYVDTRFLMPIFPLLICLIVILIKGINYRVYPIFRIIFIIYLTMFIFFGCIALGYSTLISISRDKFPEYYGNNESLKENYKNYFSKKKEVNADKDNEILHLLNRF